MKNLWVYYKDFLEGPILYIYGLKYIKTNEDFKYYMMQFVQGGKVSQMDNILQFARNPLQFVHPGEF